MATAQEITPQLRERLASLALSLVAGVGPVRHAELVRQFGSALGALESQFSPRERDDALERASKLMELGAQSGAELVVRGEGEYPERLDELHIPPAVLWLRGNRVLLDAPCVAIVGTRKPTPYGERVTRDLAFALARAGAVIVSGMAMGIDGAAHHAALDVGGTIGVLGTGVDVAYPRVHVALHERLAERGLLVSEEPPGQRATPGSFPKRNRIIAALSSAVIVVEADHDSGALITAGHALELHRTVAAVPGPIDSPRSNGTNRLLRDGAILIAEVADALALVGLRAAPERDLSGASPGERAVWKALANGAHDVDTLTAAVDLPLRETLAALTALELAGAVECTAAGEIRRR